MSAPEAAPARPYCVALMHCLTPAPATAAAASLCQDRYGEPRAAPVAPYITGRHITEILLSDMDRLLRAQNHLLRSATRYLLPFGADWPVRLVGAFGSFSAAAAQTCSSVRSTAPVE